MEGKIQSFIVLCLLVCLVDEFRTDKPRVGAEVKIEVIGAAAKRRRTRAARGKVRERKRKKSFRLSRDCIAEGEA